MRLHIVHRTHYAYATPVKDSCNEARLQPVEAEGQVCHGFLLKVLPAARLSHFRDFYLNYVHYFEIAEPHTTLTVEAISTVSTTTALALSWDLTPAPLDRLPECQRLERCYDFLQPSTSVDLSPAAWRMALDATAGCRDVWQAGVAMMRFIHTNFTYTPAVTTVSTHMNEVLESRRGVCQDFAHVLLGLCRVLRIPARYVSGYLYNGPTDQLLGTQASHAWVEIFVPGVGWRGLDPTNNTQPDERYVKLAAGRDYADVAPLKGHYKGATDRVMRVEVEVGRVSE